MKKYHIISIFAFSFCQIASANTILSEISSNVKSVCMAPDTIGKKWNVEVLASGDVNVGLKLAGKAGADAKVAFSKSEWNGVQQVLKEQQSSENANYRRCAENVTKIFIDKLNNNSDFDLTDDDDSKLPLTLVGGNKNIIYFTANIYFTETGIKKMMNYPGSVTVSTPDSTTYKLTEGKIVNVLINKKIYALSLSFNKEMEPVYTLSTIK